MKTPNFDKQVEKILITPVKKLKKKYQCQCCFNASYQLLRTNQVPFYFENKSQTNCTRNTVKYSTALYFCKAVPNAAVFTVVFQVI